MFLRKYKKMHIRGLTPRKGGRGRKGRPRFTLGDMSSPNSKTRRKNRSIWSLEPHIVGGKRNKLFYAAVCSLRKLSNRTIEEHIKRGVGDPNNASGHGTQRPEVGIRVGKTDTVSVTLDENQIPMEASQVLMEDRQLPMEDSQEPVEDSLIPVEDC